MDVNKYIKSGILEQYVLGLMSDEEAKQIEHYANEYPLIRKKIRKLKSCMEHYSKLHAIPPPERASKPIPNKKDYLEKCGGLSLEFKRGADMPCPVASMDYTWLKSGIAAMLIVSLAALVYSFYHKQSKVSQQLARVSKELKETKAAYNSVSYQNEKLAQQCAFLKDLSTQRITLMGAEPKSQAVLYCNPNHRKTYLNVVNLPAPPEGHQYHLWANVNNQDISMGMLEAALDSIDHLLDVPFMEDSKAFSVTLEDETVGCQRSSDTKVCLKGQMRNSF